MSRRPDADRHVEVLDAVVDYLATVGVHDVSIRRVATHIGISPSGLVHHFGTKEAMVEHATLRAIGRLAEIQDRWLARTPDMTVADLVRRWWRWTVHDRANLRLVALSIHITTLPTDVVRASARREPVRWWLDSLERLLVEAGLDRATARVEATELRATFNGLVVDLRGTGERTRTTAALEGALARLEGRLAGVALGEPEAPTT